MNYVQPLRTMKSINLFKNELIKTSYRDYILFLCGITLGRRIGDLLSFKVLDLRGKTHIEIREQKTKKACRLAISEELQIAIKSYSENMEDDEYLFQSRKRASVEVDGLHYEWHNNRKKINGKESLEKEWKPTKLQPDIKGYLPITNVQAYRTLNACAKKLGIEEIGTHTLRKTFGYHFYQRTKDIALLQMLLGHSNPSITLRYIGISQDMIDVALIEHSSYINS